MLSPAFTVREDRRVQNINRALITIAKCGRETGMLSPYLYERPATGGRRL